MNAIRQIFQASFLLLLTIVAWPLSAIPGTDVVQPPNQSVELQRNPDYACTQCHKIDSEGMHGTHAKEMNPNTNLAITCTNCHGKASASHRDGAADVMRYTPDQHFFKPAQQNSVCMTCHQPEQLQKALWVHDVHMLKQSCSGCHQLHPAKDPMKGLDEKGQIKLCVTCHSQLQKDNP